MIEEINSRIKKEICYKTLEKLTDINLLSEYKKCESVKNKIKILENIILKYINDEYKNKIIEDYLLELIPPGTKGVIRGNLFNKIVKQYIINLNLNKERFEICFEQLKFLIGIF